MKFSLPILGCAILAIGASHAAMAQSKITPEIARRMYEFRKGTIPFIPAAVNDSAPAKTSKITAAGEPLLSKARFSYNGTSFEAVDSNHYTFSGGRTTWNIDREDSIFFDKNEKYKYDKSSAKYILSNKTHYAYTGTNYVTGIIDSGLDVGTGDFPPLYRTSKTYDASFNKTSELYEVWNETTAAWVNDDRYTYTYDAANYLLTTKREDWNTSTSTWNNAENNVNVYNAAHSLLSETQQFWDVATSSWKNYNRTTNTYDAAEHKLTKEFEDYDFAAASLRKSSKTLYTYTATWKESVVTFQTWKAASSAYENSAKVINTYDASDRLKERIQQDWVPASSSWLNFSRYFDFTYSASGKPLVQQYYRWVPSSWVLVEKLSLTYNAADFVVRFLDEAYDVSTGVWYNYGEEISTYNATNDRLTFVDSKIDPSTFEYLTKRNRSTYNASHQKTRSVNDHSNGGAFYYESGDNLTRYHYTETPTAISEDVATNVEVSLYPVPANEQCTITVQWATAADFSIVLYDVAGHVYQQENHRAQSAYTGTIDTKQLPSGNYFICVQNINGSRLVKSINVIH